MEDTGPVVLGIPCIKPNIGNLLGKSTFSFNPV